MSVNEMSSWDRAVEVVLRHEGGFVDNPADPGGATKYGISLRWLAQRGGLGDFDHDGDVDVDDIRIMDRDQAMLLYKQNWWDRYDYGHIHDTAVATKIFDMAVNMGAPQAHKLVQRALAAVDHPVAIDGVFGPNTLRAVNSSESCLLEVLKATQAMFYWHLVQIKPQLAEFEVGWMRRAYS